MEDDERVVVETVVDAAPDVVWRWLREPALIQRWFGWDDDGLAAEIEYIFRTEVEADDDARTLTWGSGERLEAVPAENGGTVVRVVRHGHEGPGTWDGVYDEVDEGWITFLHQLRFALTHHPEAERRTISAHGLDLGPPHDPLLTRLGVRPLGDQPAGSGYTLVFPDGGTVAGEVFFQTDLQLGLTVPDEGNALLVIARTPPETAPPNGRATFILSLYGADGVDDELFAAAEQRWSRWWSQDAPAAASA